jgi:hypothetical protein
MWAWDVGARSRAAGAAKTSADFSNITRLDKYNFWALILINTQPASLPRSCPA